MSVSLPDESATGAAVPRKHHVQFCADTRVLATDVAAYLKEGFDLGEFLVVIAVPERQAAFAEALCRLGEDPEARAAEGRLVRLDARETLARFMTDEGPDGLLFEEVVGRLLRRLGDGGRGLRAYGEMVDLLWQEGRTQDAVRLEDFWNRLQQRVRFALYCNYSVDLLDSNVLAGDLGTILSRHSALHPCAPSKAVEQAVDRALAEVLGVDALEALRPLIRATQYPKPLVPGPEATLLWVRRHLPAHAGAVLSAARAHLAEGV